MQQRIRGGGPMKRILFVLAALLLASSALAVDNGVVVTNGSGTTMATKDIGAGIQSPRVNLIDVTGNPCTAAAAASSVCVVGIQGVTSGTPVPVNGTVTGRVVGNAGAIMDFAGQNV